MRFVIVFQQFSTIIVQVSRFHPQTHHVIAVGCHLEVSYGSVSS